MSLSVVQFPLELEYKKHSNIVPPDIARLRAWLHTQPHMPEQYITDLDLILAYSCCNCSMEVTKQVLDLHYTFKTHSILFKDRIQRFEDILHNMKTVAVFPLKLRAHDGSAVLYSTLIDSDVKNFNFCEGVRIVEIVIDLIQYEEGSWPGLHYMVDMQNVSLAHLSKLDLVTLQQLFYFLQEAMLLKIKGLHFLNAPSFMDKVMFLIRPFIKKELLEDLHIHQAGHKTLEPYVPLLTLPADLGGQGATIEKSAAHMIQKIKDNQPFFVSEQKKRINESLRPGKPKSITDIFGGIEGSFKKLDID